MSLPRYPNYKDSGVNWLGEVPGHWEIKRIKYLVASMEQGWSPQCEGFPVQSEDEWGVLKVGCVNGGVFRPEENKALPTELEPVPVLGLSAGDLLISRANTRELVGGAAISSRAYPRLMLCDKLYRIRLHADTCEPSFLVFYLGAPQVRGQIELTATGASSSMLNIAQSTILELEAPVPLLAEQTAIATFLNSETAKIDELVAEQRRLMELLKEKRQAVISHAVTRGLNPDAPLKSSGIKWLGDVPEHWNVCSIRRVVLAIEQGWSPECHSRPADDDEWGVLKAGCVNRGIYDQQENKALPSELAAAPQYEVRVGDVLMSRASGSTELVGSTALVTSTRPKLMLSDKIFRLILEPLIEPKFFVAALNSRSLRSQIEQALSGGNGLANNLPQSSLLSFFLCVPSVVEQRAIYAFLTTETAKLDALFTETQHAIDLLLERRTALISAAVTGQIKVTTE